MITKIYWIIDKNQGNTSVDEDNMVVFGTIDMKTADS